MPSNFFWRELFLVALGTFNLVKHIDDTERDVADPDWVQNDCAALTWLYQSISHDVMTIVLSPSATARTIWLAIENLFLDNKESRAIQLESQFRNFSQGSMSITQYCNKLKDLADDIRDVSETITNRTLVLTALRGLNENFVVYKTTIPTQRPFPSFLATRSLLLLHEQDLPMSHGSLAPASAFIVHNTPSNSSHCDGGG